MPIDDPSSSRKLLILDLNGTLLYREGRPQGPRRYRRDRANGSSEPQPRVVHPRPYMGSFRQYLFHPKTLEWLDTMVWSSAQPFNVNHMVDQCFKEEKDKLVAVWARDTLGLTSLQYHQKTQTTKDLAKPWAALSLLPDENEQASALSSSEDGPSHSTDWPAPITEPSPSAHAHSALTTLLLDDSPLKAQLQPWNHFCVPEYTAQIRGRDLSTRQHERDKPPSDIQDAGAVVSQKKRKKSKKALGYDQILLAVIGVLDTIKGESNVSGWMRQTGLWSGVREEEEEKPMLTREETADEEVEKSGTRKRRRISDNVELDGEKSRSFDSGTPDYSSPTVEATSISPEDSSVANAHNNTSPSSSLLRAQSPVRDLVVETNQPSSLSQLTPEDGSPTTPKRKESSSSQPPSSPPLVPSSQTTEHDLSCSSPGLEPVVLPDLDGHSEDNSIFVSPQPPDNQHVDPSSPSPLAVKDKLWFENEALVSHWAKLGLEALAALGIPAEAGI
ncbi:uncharacterized protein EV420DRAFT_1616176 [Desarmillaria tabescens]|uniref:Mitochondrial import inner membrane translocase subunit TIM50 n=1 Tax=Armillaria tabescens TaxID=1929756 RepID=A0AA39T7E2_ARMTA|nr:uncharacterized protein EV420DRAFT_1616176 [Desarmillaria tabescens]KAK0469616.1 hypothetical protein EV420DRAFT_1616176 [Desarmillaria tabescens]